MVKRFALLFFVFVLAAALYGQSGTPTEGGSELTVGKTASLGVEASTAFAWDIDNKSTGLETKAGLELIFPLFPVADRGLYPDSADSPAVRLALRDAAFTWRNVFETSGGNYEQDYFNSWQARPLVLSFDSFSADVIYSNYFFRVASSTTTMRTDLITLFSIFDDVIDANDRWYVRRAATRALWSADRYNVQQFPLLKERIGRDYVDDDYRTSISGMLALGAEFEWFNVAVKAASNKNGRDNNDNAWLLGLDAEIVPITNLKLGLSGFAGLNYEKADIHMDFEEKLEGKNPVNFGVGVEYRLPLSDYFSLPQDRFFLTPKAGFDFSLDTESGKYEWEFGAGVLFYTRGYDYLTSSRILDWDNVIPVGASLSMNINQDNGLNVMMSMFEPSGKDSMIPYLGGFLQLELGDLLGVYNSKLSSSPLSHFDFGFLAQIEYMIAEKYVPYIRGGYTREFQTGSGSTTKITGDYLIKGIIGCYITPIHFFSIDVNYEMGSILPENGNMKVEKNLLNFVFTIRM